MNKTTATRAGLIAAAVTASVLNGSPLIVPIMGAAIYLLIKLAIYGMDVTDRALELASARRVAELTWELRTEAARQRLAWLRLQDQRDRWTQAHPHTAKPQWPAIDLDRREPDLITPAYGVQLLCGVSA